MITTKEFMKGLISFFLGVLGIFLVQYSGSFMYHPENFTDLFSGQSLSLLGLSILFLIPGIYLIKRYC